MTVHHVIVNLEHKVNGFTDTFVCHQDFCDFMGSLEKAIEHAIKNQYKVEDNYDYRRPKLGRSQNFNKHAPIVQDFWDRPDFPREDYMVSRNKRARQKDSRKVRVPSPRQSYLHWHSCGL
jgi:hypothetical protein